MGVNISTPEMEQAARRRSKTIDDGLEAERLKQLKTVKVLMLGLSGAGKSTLAKQVRIIHEKGFADREKALYKEIVRQNLAADLYNILSQMEECGLTFDTEEIRQAASTVKTGLASSRGQQTLTSLRPQIGLVTSQRLIREFVDSKLDLEAAQRHQYLFRSQERILGDSYCPSDMDVLKVRQKTIGLNEVNFHFKGFDFKLCDVDGEGSIKKKWLQNFENVSAILFAVSLSSYNIHSTDHDGQMEIHDALKVFLTVCNYKGFEGIPIILFLNKKDLFQQKLAKYPLTTAFPEYKGPSEFSAASSFIRDKFEHCAQGQPPRVHIHFTNATDTGSVRSVFDATLGIVLDRA